MIAAESERIFHRMVQQAREETHEQLKAQLNRVAEKTTPLIDGFFEKLDAMFDHGRYNGVPAEDEYVKLLEELTSKTQFRFCGSKNLEPTF